MQSLFVPLVLAAAVQAAGQEPIALAAAARAFQEARWVSSDDGTALWGKPLYGPILLVDPQTRTVVANQADAEGRFNPGDGLWKGVLPPEVIVANTATAWAGVSWTMLMWPLPEEPAMRSRVMMHECWHRIQSDIHLPAPETVPNAHLDTRAGRTWLRLEWNALAAALVENGGPRTRCHSRTRPGRRTASCSTP